MGTEKGQSPKDQLHAWVPTGVTELIDDLLWTYSCVIQADPSLRGDENLCVIMREYVRDTDFYSDGSPIGEDYEQAWATETLWAPKLPPHRRCTCETRRAVEVRQSNEALQARCDQAPANRGPAW